MLVRESSKHLLAELLHREAPPLRGADPVTNLECRNGVPVVFHKDDGQTIGEGLLHRAQQHRVPEGRSFPFRPNRPRASRGWYPRRKPNGDRRSRMRSSRIPRSR